MLLAALLPEEREAYLASTDFKPVTSRTVTDPQHLAEILSRVKSYGYAWVDGELDPAICGMAVPLRDQAGQVVAAISISMISGTASEASAKKRFLVPLKRTARKEYSNTNGRFAVKLWQVPRGIYRRCCNSQATDALHTDLACFANG